MKYFVTSDIHSHFSALKNELCRAGFTDNSKLILVGDAFDRGEEVIETYMFLKKLLDDGRLIWIYGNHEIMLLNQLKSKYVNPKGLVYKTAYEFAKFKLGRDPLNNQEIVDFCGDLVDILENKLVTHFETEHYIFAHGIVPMKGNDVDPNWRGLPLCKWFKPSNFNGMKCVMVNGLNIENKTLVCGHVSCSYGNVRESENISSWDNIKFKKLEKNIKNKDNFLPYYGNKVIGIDGYACKTNHVNCIVIED